jgi:hypothetical protein
MPKNHPYVVISDPVAVTTGEITVAQLKEVRASLPTTLDKNDAWGIALLADDSVDEETKAKVWRYMLDTYVSWKMVNDDDFWNLLGQTV